MKEFWKTSENGIGVHVLYLWIYCGGFVVTLTLMIIAERSSNLDDALPGDYLSTIALLWPLTLPIILFSGLSGALDLIAHPSKTSKDKADRGSISKCARCHAPMPDDGEYCPRCGQGKEENEGDVL